MFRVAVISTVFASTTASRIHGHDAQPIQTHESDGMPVKGPDQSACLPYFGSVIQYPTTVIDIDVGNESATVPYCINNHFPIRCAYGHYLGASTTCSPPGPPGHPAECHRYVKTTYSRCKDLDTMDLTAQVLDISYGPRNVFDWFGTYKSCSDYTTSREVFCYCPNPFFHGGSPVLGTLSGDGEHCTAPSFVHQSDDEDMDDEEDVMLHMSQLPITEEEAEEEEEGEDFNLHHHKGIALKVVAVVAGRVAAHAIGLPPGLLD